MTFLSSLTLTGFRNYETATLSGLENGFVILIGDNGAGKTNCLEGISILSPGRGLRGASVAEMQSQKANALWAVSAEITDTDGDVTRLGVGRDPQKPDKKIVRADGTAVKNQEELGDILRTIWLTPQMDGLFLQGSSERRRFFDRLVATYDGSHTGRMTRYEKVTRERLTLLKNAAEGAQKYDADWVHSLEHIMAETSVAIAAARMDFLDRLQSAIDNGHDENFPHAILGLNGDVEQELKNRPAVDVEAAIVTRLQKLRDGDGLTGKTHYGVHRTDMAVTYANKNVPAAQCSTGEQKALLTAIILAHARMVAARFGSPPLLLFDEVAAHFDAHRRDALFGILGDLGGQIWLTGQDMGAFDSLSSRQILEIRNNTVLTCE